MHFSRIGHWPRQILSVNYSANYNVDGFILISMFKKNYPDLKFHAKNISLFVRVCMCVNKYIRAMMYCILRRDGFY